MSANAWAADTLQPWVRAQLQTLAPQPGHAWLLAGPSGLGQYALGLALAQSWLCEQAQQHLACGRCASCHAVQVRTHADLCLLMPETLMLELDWPLASRAQQEIDDKKRKPSKEIRVEAMRETIEFAQRTSARGQGKVVLIVPAERMNAVTANALLKILEEPPAGVRFILASEQAQALLPTLRSRCLQHTMAWPEAATALPWLQAQGLTPDEATVLLRAAGGRPDEALRYTRSERGAAFWQQLPQQLMQGELPAAATLGVAELLDALHKLCHDLLALRAGAAPRFFDAADLKPCQGQWRALSAWSVQLRAAQKTVHHPFHTGLFQEALVEQARLALHS